MFMVFLAAVVATLWLLQAGLDHLYVSRVDNKINRLFRHSIDTPIMVFGSSVAQYDVDPDIVADSTQTGCFNMGLPAMTFAQYQPVMLEFARYTEKCRYVVLCCDFSTLCTNQLVVRPDLFYAYIGQNDDVYHAMHHISPVSATLARYLPGYKLTLLNKAFYNSLRIGKFKYQRGFDRTRNWGWDDRLSFWPQVAQIEPQLLADFKNCISLLAQKKLKIILVFNPEQSATFDRVLNHRQILDTYRQMVGDNVYFLDYSKDSMNADKRYFFDFWHLNTLGAKVYSRKLGRDIAAITKARHN